MVPGRHLPLVSFKAFDVFSSLASGEHHANVQPPEGKERAELLFTSFVMARPDGEKLLVHPCASLFQPRLCHSCTRGPCKLVSHRGLAQKERTYPGFKRDCAQNIEDGIGVYSGISERPWRVSCLGSHAPYQTLPPALPSTSLVVEGPETPGNATFALEVYYFRELFPRVPGNKGQVRVQIVSAAGVRPSPLAQARDGPR